MIRLSPSTLDSILPPPRINSWEWIKENAFNKRGLPFDFLSYPWMQGICEEWDNPARERIFLMAGSRLGKTELGLCLLECGMATAPDIAMIGGPTDTKVAQWIKDRLIPMVENCDPLRPYLPPEHRRPPHKLILNGTIYGAWSGSPTTLGDLDPRYLLAFEVDKFTKASSEEADSLLLLLERGAEIMNRRVYGESTGTVYGKSRIHKLVHQGTNCRFHVPCPFCRFHQKLELGNKEYGIIWDPGPDGKSDPNTTRKTARYRCKGCLREIEESKRFIMIQNGKWCPKGCKIDKAGRRRGTPENDGPDATFQISRLYGPSFTFGKYAAAFVEAVKDKDPEKYRSWLNNWAGECWQATYKLKKWEEVAEKLCLDSIKMSECPETTQFITMGVDVQVDHWVFWVSAWSAGGKGACIKHGIVHSWAEVAELIRATYDHADGGPDLLVAITLVDARDGNRTDEVNEFCRSMLRAGYTVYPCMGSRSSNLKGKPFTKQVIDDENATRRRKSKRRGFNELQLITINTNFYQSWIHNALNRRDPADNDSLVFPMSCRFDQDLFEQLLSEHPEFQVGGTCVWEKNAEGDINDLRDTARYSRVGADVYVNQNWNRVDKARRLSETKRPRGEGIKKGRRKTSSAAPAGKKTPWVRKMKIGR